MSSAVLHSVQQETAEKEKSLLVQTYDRLPVLLERGEGVYLYDSEGKRYLDFLSGIGVNALGHVHPEIRQVIEEQAGKLLHTSNLFYHHYQSRVAEKLTAMSGLDRAFFCNSGTEAWETALKLARAYGKHIAPKGAKPKTKFLVMENSFHGRTYGALSTTGQKKYRDPYTPLLPGVTFVKFNKVEDLKKKFNDSVVAIGLETVQGEGGIVPVSREFLAAARELTANSGALLILDEIQCGCGRTGKYFAYQNYDVTPDIVTVAKPLAGGLPLGAILTTHKVAEAFHPGMHGTTFGGGPLACATADKFLEILSRPGTLEHIAELGEYFRERLGGLKKKYKIIREVRGMGLMNAANLKSADVAKAVMKQMLERGVIINRTHDTVLRFLPPYIIEREHIDEMISALDEVLRANSGKAAPVGRE